MDQLTAQTDALKLMAEAETAVLTTIGRDGYPSSRAMLNLRRRLQYPGLVPFFDRCSDEMDLYFTTNTSSGKIAELALNAKACAYFTIPSEWKGLMLGGDIVLVTDPVVKGALWQENWTMYYPRGVSDPDYSILRLRPKTARYYAYLDACTWNPGVDSR